MRVRCAVASFALLLAGCSDIPLGGEPRVARSGTKLGRIAVAPVTTIALAQSEVARGWRADEVFRRADELDLQKGVARGLELSSGFEAIRLAESPDAGEAWRSRDDYVLSLAIEDVRIEFERNGWYVPNLVNFVLWVWPGWMVAKEDYTLAFEARARVESGDSGQTVVPEVSIPVAVTGSFDEFDRGFQLLGPISPSNDAENWRLVASRLLPAARRQLAEKLVVALDGARLGAGTSRKTLVLAVGVTRYADVDHLPRLAHASDDAQAFADVFVEQGFALPHHVVVLRDDRADVASVRAAIAGHLARAHEGDDVVVYFAGYGTRNANGAPALLPSDASPGAGGLPLAELGALLSGVPGNKLLVLDASFDGGSRGIRAGAAPEAEDLGAALGDPGTRVVAAADVQQPALAPDHLGHGAFTHHLIQALRGHADENHDGRLTVDELFAYAHERVVRAAAYAGTAQSPRQAGQRALSFTRRPGR